MGIMKEKRKIIKIIVLLVLLPISLILWVFFRIALDRKGTPSPEKVEAKDSGDWKKFRPLIKSAREWFLKQEPEEVEIISRDGLKLHGYYLPCEEAVRTVVCVHGYHGSGMNDFAYVAKFYHENQCNVLLIDQRAHGKSEGNFICYGVKERYDVIDWLYFVTNQSAKKEPVFLDGVSMGATTVLMCSNQELPKEVRGIIADCGYTSPWDIYKEVSKRKYHLPEIPFMHLYSIICKWKAGFWPKEASALDAVKEARVPILFVHGQEDDFVPFFMGEKLYEACTSKKKMVVVEKAGHALSYMVDEERLQKELLQFFKECQEKESIKKQ